MPFWAMSENPQGLKIAEDKQATEDLPVRKHDILYHMPLTGVNPGAVRSTWDPPLFTNHPAGYREYFATVFDC